MSKTSFCNFVLGQKPEISSKNQLYQCRIGPTARYFSTSNFYCQSYGILLKTPYKWRHSDNNSELSLGSLESHKVDFIAFNTFQTICNEQMGNLMTRTRIIRKYSWHLT